MKKLIKNWWKKLCVGLAASAKEQDILRPINDQAKAIRRGTIKRTVIAGATLAVATATQAQQVTNVGPGEAGTGMTHGISISEGGQWIIINGNWYIIQTQTKQSVTNVNITKWDAVQKKYVPYGIVVVQSLDGTQTLTGAIQIRDHPRFTLVSFKAIKYVTPKIAPTGAVKGIIAVYVYSGVTGTFVPRPDLNYNWPRVDGTVWLNSNYTFHSGVFNTLNPAIPGYQLNIIPAPAGPTSNVDLYPYKHR